MTDWRTTWAHLLTTADDAVRLVESGDNLFLPFSQGQPPALIAALVAQCGRFERPVQIWTAAASFGVFDFADPACAGHLHARLVHPGQLRTAVAEGRASYVPIDNVDLCRLLDQRLVPCDVVLVHVSPPDDAGFCSLGLSVGPAPAMLRAARRVIAQINPNMPRTFGDSLVHMSRFDAVVEAATPLREWQGVGAPASPLEVEIAENVARLITDGSAVQTGIGSLADAVLTAITHKRRLTIRSGMISDGVRALVDSGALASDGDGAPIHTGSAIGSRDLYGWAHENPLLSMDSTESLHAQASREPGFTAVNSAVEVDLTGQANIEALNGRLIGGVGGQLRFMLSAGDSEGGRSILAMPSVSNDGRCSRVRARLTDVPIGTPRSAIHYVVTEHGIADLQGRNLEERAEAIVAVADPQFRSALRHEFDEGPGPF